MPYRKRQPRRLLRQRVQLLLDPVQAIRQSQFTPRFAAELPSVCHRLALLTGQPTDWAFATWLLLRTYASDATQRRTTTPNHLRWSRAAAILAVASGWQPRTVQRRLRELVALGFATEETFHGRRCLFWVSSAALLRTLRQWPEAEEVYSKLHWLAQRGDRYGAASLRRTFLPEIISFRSRARLRAALSQAVRCDAAPVNLGRIKQAALLGIDHSTARRRVTRAMRRGRHEHLAAHYHKIWQAPRGLPLAERQATLRRIIQASRKAYANGETPSPLLLKQQGNELIVVRQLPSRSRNPYLYAFTGADYARRLAPRTKFQDLRPTPRTVSAAPASDGSSSLSATSTALPETQLVDPLASTTTTAHTLRAYEPTPCCQPQPASNFPIASLHRHLRDRSLVVQRTFITNRVATEQEGITVHQTLHYERDQYTEQVVHALGDWDDGLIEAQLGVEALAPAPPSCAYHQQLRHGRPTLGYFRSYTRTNRPRRQTLLAQLGPDCFSQTKRRYTPGERVRKG